mmetsp:Transcript_62988/g.178977  ORF Transcript_62988/g.178977 Transcript_62988/m.178977 type:complete len:322 (+) Transcript_62988:1036-2001(+)
MVLLVLDLGCLHQRVDKVHGGLGCVLDQECEVLNGDLAVPCAVQQAAAPVLVDLLPAVAASLPEQRRGGGRAGVRHLDEGPGPPLNGQALGEGPEVPGRELALLNGEVEGAAASLVLDQQNHLLALETPEHDLGGADVAEPRRQVQGRVAFEVQPTEARLHLQQALQAVHAVKPRGIVDWQVVHHAVRRCRSVGICSVLDEEPQGAHVAGARCQVDGLQFSAEEVRADLGRGCCTRPRCQQQLHHGLRLRPAPFGALPCALEKGRSVQGPAGDLAILVHQAQRVVVGQLELDLGTGHQSRLGVRRPALTCGDPKLEVEFER